MPIRDSYVNPLATRYASKPMLRLFSDDRKFSTWRKLWTELARAEMQLGLAITAEQVAELEAHINLTEQEYVIADAREREVRHDVMAHVYALGKTCSKAEPIIHMGATSMYVVDNTDIILMREAYQLVRARIVRTISALSELAGNYADTPCLSYTHFQAAQPTTFGRRVCLWIQDLLIDLEEVERRRTSLRLLGMKGATGTQASVLTLFGGDETKVIELDRRIAVAMGFVDEDATFPVTGQTVTRKLDSQAMKVLSGVSESAHKMANDCRLLMGLGCIEEPSKKEQIGSSAMAYKKNPMLLERMTSLARLVMTFSNYGGYTFAEQWLERTLDDSAGKRIAIPEALLGTDAVLSIYENLARGLVVFPAALMRELKRELPSMATEELLMLGCQAGGNRQVLHEVIRKHSHAVAQAIKQEGAENDLLQRIANDPAFVAVKDEIPKLLDDPGRFLGRSENQVREFLDKDVGAVLCVFKSDLDSEAGEVKV